MKIKILSIFIFLFFYQLEAKGKKLNSYDMASLYYISDLVIEADELGYEEKDWILYGKVIVKDVYKGSNIIKGDTIKVSMSTIYTNYLYGDSIYGILDSNNILNNIKIIKNEIESNRVLLFLVKDKDYYKQVLSGKKVIRNNDVFRYIQYSNPGPFYLIPQKEEFIDKQTFYTVSELKSDLKLAIKRVEKFQKSYQTENIQALKQYLPLLPYQQAEPYNFHANWLSRKTVHKLIELCDEQTLSQILKEYEGKCEYYVTTALKDAIATKNTSDSIE